MELRSILFFCHPIVRRELTYAGVPVVRRRRDERVNSTLCGP